MMMHLLNSECPKNALKNGYNRSKKFKKLQLKLQIPHYHPLNQWFLGTTNGNQGQTMMHI